MCGKIFSVEIGNVAEERFSRDVPFQTRLYNVMHGRTRSLILFPHSNHHYYIFICFLTTIKRTGRGKEQAIDQLTL